MARISAVGLLVVVSAGCPAAETERPYPAPNVESSGKVIATIGPVRLTTGEIEKRIRQQSPFVRVQLKDPTKLKLFVEEQIRNEVLAQEAWKQKLYDDPAIHAELRRALIQKVMKDHLATVKDDVDTTETELLSAYKERLAEFNKPEKIRLSQIVRYVDDDAERKAARQLLEKVKNERTARRRAITRRTRIPSSAAATCSS
jgi:hypothetical protein